MRRSTQPLLYFLSLRTPLPPTSPLFPYTTLFRSRLDDFPPGNFSAMPSLDQISGIGQCPMNVTRREIGRAHVCSSHRTISYAVFCLKKKSTTSTPTRITPLPPPWYHISSLSQLCS